MKGDTETGRRGDAVILGGSSVLRVPVSLRLRVCAFFLLATTCSVAVAQTTSWPAVPPVDFSKLKPSDFKDDELDIPYYLSQFHRVANSVIETGENRGFIDIAVWRSVQDNKPYNARIMENILSLAYFYATNRPWNQYYGSPAVRARLEAALDFWCRMQSPEGQFSEYGPQRWNLAATAFATKFMGETLRLLNNGPPIDKTLLDRVAKVDRKAIHVVLTDPVLYQHGKNFTNQFTNAWAGGLAYLALYSDPQLRTLVHRRIRLDSPVFQSSAGYFYEARGPDFGYNLGTHHSNLWMSWHYARGTPLAKTLVEEERRFIEWLAYNAVREPDGSGYTLNRAIETRQQRPFLDSIGISRSLEEQGQRLLASEVVLARAFAPTREGVTRNRREQRAALEKNWPPKTDLAVGTFSTFSPYAFLHRSHTRWFATDVQRRAAIGLLPYLQRQYFVHQRMDPRERLIFTFIRQPSYYATFNSGPHLTAQQRHGLGLLWNPQFGTAIQSQTGSNNAAWGTLLDRNLVPFEGDTLSVDFKIGARPVIPVATNRDLGDGVLTISYGFPDQGEKTLTFGPTGVSVNVQRSGPIHEQIPLLVGEGDDLRVTANEIQLKRGTWTFLIALGPETKAEKVETNLRVGPRRVITVLLSSTNSLTYTMSFR
jgi:hypothetical protein